MKQPDEKHIKKILSKPVLKIASPVDEEWDREDVWAEPTGSDREQFDLLEEEVYDDEITSGEEGFVRGYWRARQKA